MIKVKICENILMDIIVIFVDTLITHLLLLGRVDLASKEKEREEKIRRMRELQEEQRKKKLEELKQHVSRDR